MDPNALSPKMTTRPLTEAIASQLAIPGDYISHLRSALEALATHLHGNIVGIRLYGHTREGLFTFAVPESKYSLQLESLFNAVYQRRCPFVHRPDRQTRFGTASFPDFPALAAPVMRGSNLQAAVVVLRHRGMTFDLADLSALDSCLPLLLGTIEEALMQRTMIAGYLKTIETLALALEAKDPYTRGHSNMVAAYSTAIADRLRLDPQEREIIALGAIMHDLGKIGVADNILTKPGPLTPAEFDQMKKHPVIGEQILKPLDHPYLDAPRQIVRSHHERLDGRGYPDGLVAAEIPLRVRIVSVADAWDAMTSDRPYRAALPYHVAAGELLYRSGDMWDPEIVREHLAIVYPAGLSAPGRVATLAAA